MPSNPNAPDVIVVGAGPVGLGVALGLARAGRAVLVLEKRAGTAVHSRAPAIWPPTQEILAGLGVLDRFVAEGRTLGRIGLHDADTDEELISIPLDELAGATRYPRLLILPQSRTEGLLCEALRGHPSARVLFSAEVVEVEQDASKVTVRYSAGGVMHSVAAPFAVGCDGAHSAVRKCLGASFDGDTYEMRAALADVELRHPENLPFPRLTGGDGLAIGIRMRGDLWRLILPFSADDDRPLDDRVERAAVHLFPEVGSAADYKTVWQSEFRLHRRVASTFVLHRIALAGDAAHLNSPVGGQGMNAGLQDAAALTRSLLEAITGDDQARLDEYGRERRRAVEAGVNRFTDRLTRLLLLGRGGAIKPILRLARHLLRIPPLRRRFLRRIAMVGPD